jgi:hypothetical protein
MTPTNGLSDVGISRPRELEKTGDYTPGFETVKKLADNDITRPGDGLML